MKLRDALKKSEPGPMTVVKGTDGAYYLSVPAPALGGTFHLARLNPYAASFNNKRDMWNGILLSHSYNELLKLLTAAQEAYAQLKHNAASGPMDKAAIDKLAAAIVSANKITSVVKEMKK